MKLAKIKTDKSDAKMICKFALINQMPLYITLTDVQSDCLHLFRVLDNFIRYRTAIKIKCTEKKYQGFHQSSHIDL